MKSLYEAILVTRGVTLRWPSLKPLNERLARNTIREAERNLLRNKAPRGVLPAALQVVYTPECGYLLTEDNNGSELAVTPLQPTCTKRPE